jgi:N-methylhydantoinase A
VALAEMIYARDVIAPLHPGITAAMGLLVTELRYEYTRSVLTVLQKATAADFASINESLDKLTADAGAQLASDGIPASRQKFTRIAECRYLGQGFELRAEMPAGPLGPDNVKEVVKSFFAAHKLVYGHAFEDQLVEIVTVRVVATADVEMLRLPDLEKGHRKDPKDALLYVADTIFDDGKAHATPRYARGKLLDGDTITGPALIVQHNSTTLVPPGYRASVLSHGDMRITRA